MQPQRKREFKIKTNLKEYHLIYFNNYFQVIKELGKQVEASQKMCKKISDEKNNIQIQLSDMNK